MSAEFARLMIAELNEQIDSLRADNYSGSYSIISFLRIQIRAIENVMAKMGHTL